MRLTADFILQCAQYTNALKDRELDLRGYKIPVIENLGATLDQFDTLDLSDNDIRKLEGFPLLNRVRTLLFNNNRICRIAEGLEQPLPHLETIVLTNNSIQSLDELRPLETVKTLRYLSLLRNPVCNKPHYRLHVINMLPQIRVLDFQRIKQRERDASKRMFGVKKTVKNETTKKPKTFTPGVPTAVVPPAPRVATGPKPNDVAAIKAAITNAKSLDEVQKLEMLLKSGGVPTAKPPVAEEMDQV